MGKKRKKELTRQTAMRQVTERSEASATLAAEWIFQPRGTDCDCSHE